MLGRMPSRRDAILVLVGASCFYVFSAFVGVGRAPDHSIIINTEYADTGHTVTEITTATATATEYVTAVPTQAVAAVPVDLGLVQNFPETSVVAHAPGWTIFQNLYMSRGALLLLTSDESKFPDFRLMTSTGLPGNLTNDAERIPTPRDMAFITPEEARAKWGADGSSGGRNRVLTVEGTTLLFNDPSQFLNHFHFVAELIFGSWAFLYGAFADGTVKPPASIHFPDPSFNSPLISTSTPKIDRAIFIHTDVEGWRDAPGFNGYFLRAVFPSMTVEVQTDWIDRVNATTKTKIDRAWHFPLVLLTDRSAAFRDPITGWYTQRTAAAAWTAMAQVGKIDLIGNWWASMRAAMLRYAGGDPHEELHPTLQVPDKIVITYINRQGTRRHLNEEDNHALVTAVEELVERKNQEGKNWEFNNVHAEQLSLDEQVRVAAKSTIMLGVHGNGLTHLVLMKPNRVSAVIEIFLPGGFARDYEWTSRALGMTHYSVWNDTVFTHPNEPKNPDYPEGFHGGNIPVSGSVVAQLIDEHVSAREAGPPATDNSPVYDTHDNARA
ncbi:hypothetical protein DFH07DRAFT_820550 [Mycena maculata]|uniref:Glycosyltransferase 61 catalytic domain-containing protein n=1 Tax=Mycena maculata TaxID=230809 RepID=A0AAD7J7Z6_9AGAR|nr:hypothetical protein DFH07DRAFT_820550 [Mycena maculata]